jgi:hypothetical protein
VNHEISPEQHEFLRVEETETKMSMNQMNKRSGMPGISDNRTPYKFGGDKIITYYSTRTIAVIASWRMTLLGSERVSR